MKALVCLDRDGTINIDPGFYGKEDTWKEQLEFYPLAKDGIRMLKQDNRVAVVVTTNQRGVAQGVFTLERANEVNAHISKILASEGVVVDGWYSCPYICKEEAIRKGVDPGSQWVLDTDLRKPGIGMIREAAKDLGIELNAAKVYAVGDREIDVMFGLNAGGKGILVRNGHNKVQNDIVIGMVKDYSGRIFFADNLVQAAEIILKDIGEAR
ncbi:MAG TPA: HAD-IIIA family hydrolase [Candidatus Nanoarchaeia archaeon]|nr:HAD-IIIA family hydrolase [Candidatus Nanoarchaeia archaeon]